MTTSPPIPSVPMLVREKQLPALLAMSRANIRKLLAAGRFPPPIRLGRHCIAWKYSDLIAWVEKRLRGRGGERAMIDTRPKYPNPLQGVQPLWKYQQDVDCSLKYF